MKFNSIMTKLFFSFVIGIISYAIYSRVKLERNHKSTVGKITECLFLPKTGSDISLKYEYYIGSISYTNSSTRRGITEKTCNENFVGKTFPVEYNPIDKKISLLLIEPRDFNEMGYSFPDSLKWVLQFIR